ncbi:MAG: glycosyltransferase [Gemmatimonadota bacterium]|nr:glycosyltransferase [Gemmatimonadota bacterium]
MKIAVIVSTYEQPDWLEKALWGYSHQTHRDFELIVADDGSGEETRRRIERLRDATGLAIEHVWHEDRGYRRQRILNRAILESRADYLVLTDGDCIPREDFVAVHADRARPGHYMSGGYCKLPMELSRAITPEDIRAQRCFDPAWLAERGLRSLSSRIKLAARGRGALLDRLTTTPPTWNNCNSSGWKSDILAVNGFDERIRYGGADRELGARLRRNGVRPIQARHRAVVIHLDHDRSYANEAERARSRALRQAHDRDRTTWTEHGIRPGGRPV